MDPFSEAGLPAMDPVSDGSTAAKPRKRDGSELAPTDESELLSPPPLHSAMRVHSPKNSTRSFSRPSRIQSDAGINKRLTSGSLHRCNSGKIVVPFNENL